MNIEESERLSAALMDPSSSPITRMIEIEKLDKNIHQALLAEIAKNTTDTIVAVAAIKKLDASTQQDVLTEIIDTRSEGYVQMEAAKKLDATQHPHHIEKVVRGNMDKTLAPEVVIKLDVSHHQALFIEMVEMDVKQRDELEEGSSNASSDAQSIDEIRKKITKNKLSYDQNRLAEIIKTNPIWYRCSDAIEELEDQELLADIALHFFYGLDDELNWYDVHLAVVKKLNDQTALENLAKSSYKHRVRLEAISKLNDRQTLEYLKHSAPEPRITEAAQDRLDVINRRPNSIDEFVRIGAIKSLVLPENSALIERIIKHAKSSKVRDAAIEKLEVYRWLTQSDPRFRVNAIDDVVDQDLLVELAKNDPDIDVRVAALQKLDADHHQDTLLMIAKDGSDGNLREVALNRLPVQENMKTITHLAKNDPDKWVRWAAVEKINDKDSLTLICEHDPSQWVRATAEKILKSVGGNV